MAFFDRASELNEQSSLIMARLQKNQPDHPSERPTDDPSQTQMALPQGAQPTQGQLPRGNVQPSDVQRHLEEEQQGIGEQIVSGLQEPFSVDYWTDSIGGIAGSLWEGVGLVYDLAAMPVFSAGNQLDLEWADDYDNFISYAEDSIVTRVADMMNNAIGPDQGFRRLTHVLPEGFREGTARGFMDTVEWGYETGEEIFRTPLTQGVVGAQQAFQTAAEDGPNHFLSDLVDPEFYNEVAELADSYSLGEALAAASARVDLSDKRHMAEVMESDFFTASAGVTDLIANMFLDPLFFATYGGAKGRARFVARDPAKKANVDEFFTPRGALSKDVRQHGPVRETTSRFLRSNFDDFDDFVINKHRQHDNDVFKVASDIARQPGIRNNPYRDQIGYTLAVAPNKESRRFALGVLLGRNTGKNLRELKNQADELNEVLRQHESALVELQRRGRGYEPIAMQSDEIETLVRNMTDERTARRLTRRIHDTLPESVQDALPRALRERLRPDTAIETHKINQLYDTSIKHIKNTLGRETMPDGFLQQSTDFLWDNQSTVRELGNSAIYAADDYANIIQFLSNAQGTLDQLPRVSRMGHPIREAVVNSRVYQSPTGQIIRPFIEKRPWKSIDVDDSTQFSKQVYRSAIEGGIDEQQAMRLQGQAARITNPTERQAFWDDNLNQEIFRKLQQDFELPDQVISAGIARAKFGRQIADSHSKRNALNNERSYAAGDADNFLVRDNEGSIDIASRPISQTQLAEKITPIDYKAVRNHLKKLDDSGLLSPFKRGGSMERAPLSEYPKEILETFNHYWKPGVLARPGWPLRVVTDENLRLFAKFGTLATIREHIESGSIRNWALRSQDRLRGHHLQERAAMQRSGGGYDKLRSEMVDEGRRIDYGLMGGALAGIGALSGAGVAGPLIPAGVGAVAGAGIARGLRKLDYSGTTAMKIRGIDGIRAYDVDGTYADKISMRDQGLVHMLRDERNAMSRYKRAQKHWGQLDPTNPEYGKHWTRLVERQIVQDPLRRRLLQGESTTDIMRWLRETEEGQQYLSRMEHLKNPARFKFRGEPEDSRLVRDEHIGQHLELAPDDYLERIRGHDLAIFNADDEAIQMALDRNITGAYRHLQQRYPKSSTWSPVNADLSEAMMGHSEINNLVERGIEGAMDMFGTIPSDELSRSLAYRMYFKDSMRRRIDNIGPEEFRKPGGKRLLEDQQAAARQESLDRMRSLMYDLQERTQAGMLLRFGIPFFNAGQEVLAAWGGIIREKPHIAYWTGRALDAPQRLDIHYEDPDSGRRYADMPLPEFAAPLLNHSAFSEAVDENDALRVPTSSFFPFEFDQGLDGFFLGGLFGTGPVAQIPLATLANRNPQLYDEEGMGDILRTMMPYGPHSEGFASAVAPAWVNRYINWSRGLTTDPGDYDSINRGHANRKLANMNDELTKMRFGERERVDFTDPEQRNAFMEEVHERTAQEQALSGFLSFAQPFPVQIVSQNQPYIDAYQQIQESLPILNATREQQGLSPLSADQIFHEVYGDEYYAYTTSLTESLDGIPPTRDAYESREEFKPLIDSLNNPDLAGFITGMESAGSMSEYSSAMFEFQLNNALYPGADENQRRIKSMEEQATNPEVSLGWKKYTRVRDYIQAELIDRGYPNIDSAPEELQNFRHAAIRAIANEYPAWGEEWEDRSIPSETEFRQLLDDMEKIVNAPNLSKRPEVRGIAEYMRIREEYLRILAEREDQGYAATMQSQDNMHIYEAWLSDVNRLVSSNPAFAEAYYRYLEHDPLTRSTAEDQMPPLGEGVPSGPDLERILQNQPITPPEGTIPNHSADDLQQRIEPQDPADPGIVDPTTSPLNLEDN